MLVISRVGGTVFSIRISSISKFNLPSDSSIRRFPNTESAYQCRCPHSSPFSPMANANISNPLVWIDCEVRFYQEHIYLPPPPNPGVTIPSYFTRISVDYPMQMTGLDVDNDVIIEIFCIITNGNLDVLDENGWGTVVHQSQETMDKMVRRTLSDPSHNSTTAQQH